MLHNRENGFINRIRAYAERVVPQRETEFCAGFLLSFSVLNTFTDFYLSDCHDKSISADFIIFNFAVLILLTRVLTPATSVGMLTGVAASTLFAIKNHSHVTDSFDDNIEEMSYDEAYEAQTHLFYDRGNYV